MKKVSILMISTLLALGINAEGLHPLDDGLTPLMKFESGHKVSGVYSAYDVFYCSQSARKENIPNALPEDTVLTILENKKEVTIKNNLTMLNPLIKEMLDLLIANGDINAVNKHICTGYFNDLEAEHGNAFSFVQGYLIFDFKLFQYLFGLPDHLRSSWVIDFLALHEFAHQLQYWNLDEEIIKALQQKQSSKVSELSADCTASALLAYKNMGLSEELYNISFTGVLGAAGALGDYNTQAQSHHGTPLERITAAAYGEKLISSQKVSILTGNIKITSGYLISSCNTYVNNNLK